MKEIYWLIRYKQNKRYYNIKFFVERKGWCLKDIKEKFLAKVEQRGNKKMIENLVVFVIILIATIIFINYIWNDDKSEEHQEETAQVLADINIPETAEITEINNKEKQLENILKNLDGVEDVQVLITYEETSKVIPMYNEDNQQSITQEEDNQGRSKNHK